MVPAQRHLKSWVGPSRQICTGGMIDKQSGPHLRLVSTCLHRYPIRMSTSSLSQDVTVCTCLWAPDLDINHNGHFRVVLCVMCAQLVSVVPPLLPQQQCKFVDSRSTSPERLPKPSESRKRCVQWVLTHQSMSLGVLRHVPSKSSCSYVTIKGATSTYVPQLQQTLHQGVLNYKTSNLYFTSTMTMSLIMMASSFGSPQDTNILSMNIAFAAHS